MSSPRDDREPPSEDADERNERVLHTRVPPSLDRHIKQRARNLGMSASTVVRNVLLTTFGLVEDIVNDSTDIALAATGHQPASPRRRGPASAGGDGEVIGWQEAVLNVNAVCEQCNAILPKGERAAIGIRDEPGPRAILCTACLGRLSAPASRTGR